MYNTSMFDLKSTIKKITDLFSLRDVVIFTLLILAFLLTRLTLLDRFPIFSDEGIYIRWAKVAWHDPSWRFISLTDGKQPLQTWLTIPFLKLFSSNALLAGRMFATSMGLMALLGMGAVTTYLFGKKGGFWGMVFYIFTPYFLFYDRLALVDSGVNAAFIWIFFFSILLASTLRLDISLIYGLIGGIGLLAKSSVRLFVGLSALAPIVGYPKHRKMGGWYFLTFYLLYGLGAGIALVLYNIQRLSPFFHYIEEKNKTFLLTLPELLQNPFQLVSQNIFNLPLYVAWESAFVVSILGVVGLILLWKKDRFLALYYTIWLLLPYIALVFITKVLFPRYIMFFATLLVMLAAFLMTRIKSRNIMLGIIAAYILSVIFFNYTIIADYKNIPFPPVDRGKYIEAWLAGLGMKEIVQFAREKSADKPVILIAEGNFGMAGDVLDVLLKPTDAISVKGYWPLSDKELRENQQELKNSHVYIVFTHRTELPADWPMKKVAEYHKPGNRSTIYLYELTQ